jgi:hypothetical protein
VDEEKAFLRLQKLASHRNRKLAEVARDVLASDEVFRGMEGDAGCGQKAGPHERPAGR